MFPGVTHYGQPVLFHLAAALAVVTGASAVLGLRADGSRNEASREILGGGSENASGSSPRDASAPLAPISQMRAAGNDVSRAARTG